MCAASALRMMSSRISSLSSIISKMPTRPVKPVPWHLSQPAPRQQATVSPSGVVAKLAGGASMFGGEGPMQIGEANAQAVAQALRVAGVRVVGEDLGGTAGRRITFVCRTGEMIIERVGSKPKVL